MLYVHKIYYNFLEISLRIKSIREYLIVILLLLLLLLQQIKIKR